MADKQEEINSTNLMKKLVKKRRFWAIIVFAILCSLADNSSTPTTQTPVQKVDVVQERINRINELYAEESSFDRVEVIGNNAIAIVFNELPDLGIEDEIDSITRGQAMNLSKEVNGVASVKTVVGGVAQMFCTATKGQVNDCMDYR